MPYFHVHVITIQGKEYFEYDQTYESVIGLFRLYNTGEKFPVSGMLIGRNEVSKIRIFETKNSNTEILGARVWDIGRDVTRELMIKSRESVPSTNEGKTASGNDKLTAPIGNFAAFFHKVFGASRVERIYPSVFTEDDLRKLGKAEKIRKILDTYKGNRTDLKITLKRIMELHEKYSKEHIDELRDIVRGFGFNLEDDLTLKEDLGEGKIEYDVALSFAGEDRQHAEALAKALKAKGVSVFYDDFEKSKLWGEDLYTYLAELYSKRAKYCIMFLSKHYAEKSWTNHERKAAQSRAFSENRAYMLPIRLDETEIPGILGTFGYVDWNREGVEDITRYVLEKLNKI